jgi:type IV pilus assembly protein PilP
MWALITASDGTIYRVRSGNYLGQNYGKIMNITEARVELSEMVPNGKGGWQEQPGTIDPSEVNEEANDNGWTTAWVYPVWK